MRAVCDFAAQPEAVRRAREFVASNLREWECEPLIDTAVLLTSELVTNAILHAQTGPTVRIHLTPNNLRVEVVDRGAGMPSKRDASPTELSGRGLALVDAMASSWGVIEPSKQAEAPADAQAAEPKVVWFELSTVA